MLPTVKENLQSTILVNKHRESDVDSKTIIIVIIIKLRISSLRSGWPSPILDIMLSNVLVFLLPKTFKLFGFPIFWLWVYLMKIILEKRRAHYIIYLRFH